MDISQEEFEKMVSKAIDQVPSKYDRIHENVVFEAAPVPTREQRINAKLGPRDGLFGLFEGVPDVGRSSGVSGILPAKITIFMHPMINIYDDQESLQLQINQTVWHEVAHYFGLGHEAMHKIQNANND